MNADPKSEVLLLGGAGFLGRALAEGLAADGASVRMVSRRPDPWAMEGVSRPIGLQYEAAALDDTARLQQWLMQAHTVFYLASNSTPGALSREPCAEAQVNLEPLLRTLDTALRVAATPHWIYLSSGGTVYGNPATNPVAEHAPLQPLSFYGAGKVAAEGFLHAHAHLAQSAVTILRPSNVYGPGQPERGKFGLVRTLLTCAARGEPVDIWGDGETVRDHLFIDDLVDAGRRLLRSPPKAGNVQTYNAGAGCGHSILEVCAAVEEVSGRKLVRRHYPARPQDVRCVILDSSALHKDTGWQPQIALSEGIGRHWRSLP